MPLASTRPADGRPEIVPPSKYAFAAHATVTLVTLAAAIVPLALVTLQCSPSGWVCTVTA